MTYFKNVVKRNGITVPFDEKKIENAIASYRRGYPGPRGIHADEMRLREDRESLHLIP